jgi:hypothetical protein
MRTTNEYLQHAVNAADRIAEYIAGMNESDFSHDHKAPPLDWGPVQLVMQNFLPARE